MSKPSLLHIRHLHNSRGDSIFLYKSLATFETTEKDHGRIEIRRYWQTDRLGWFADLSKWEGLASIGMVEYVRQR